MSRLAAVARAARLLPVVLVSAWLVLPAAPASARCDDDQPCRTACDKVAARYDEVTRKFGIPLPPFPLMCPQN